MGDALATRSAVNPVDTLASVLEDLHGWSQDAAAEAVALVTTNLQVRGRLKRVAAALTYPDRAAMVAARPQVQRLLLLGLNAEKRNSLDLRRFTGDGGWWRGRWAWKKRQFDAFSVPITIYFFSPHCLARALAPTHYDAHCVDERREE